MPSRRDFLASTTGFASLLLTNPLFAFQPAGDETGPVADSRPEAHWWLRMRRIAQHNLNEYDPKILDIGSWTDYWASLKVDAVVLTAGGFIAMYPTKIAAHHRSQFLGDRDLFGDYTKALKKKGIRVVARIETNFLHKSVFAERPEWVERNADGSPRAHSETPWVYRTCLFSNYRNEQIPKIINEVVNLYDVDAFFTNSWPQVENPPHLCNCENCRKLGNLSEKEVAEVSMQRTLETIRLINETVKKKSGEIVYNVNIAGGISAIQDLERVADLSEWINVDHQGRGGNTPIWDCAQEGKASLAVMKGKPVSNVIGIKTGPWRHSSNSAAETTMWMAQTTSSGMIPWIVCLGSELPDDRWREIGRKYFQWHADNEQHFINHRSMARIGVVFSQRINTLYKAPGKVPGGYYGDKVNPTDHGNPADYFQGMYYALLEGRFVFDLVHEDDLTPATLNKYAGIILPNIALLSDQQTAGLRQYVEGGGSLLATFETGLYDEGGNPRKESALAGLMEISLEPGYKGPKGQIFYTSAEQPHEILKDFTGVRRLAGGEYYVPIRSAGPHVLNIFPPYPNGIPEMVYYQPRAEMENNHRPTDNPAIVVREKGNSRLAYLPTDIDKNVWTSGSVDLSQLLQNTIGWMIKDRSGITVKGEGDIEVFAWETQPGFALHILNYTNPNMTRSSLRKLYPIGEQHVRMELPAGIRIAKASLLRAGKPLAFKQTGTTVEFTIPSVEDFEIAALYKS